jgi:hypothetical protein
MRACKETDVRESPNDSTLAGGEGQGSRRETRYVTFEENPISSLPERGVARAELLFNAIQYTADSIIR